MKNAFLIAGILAVIGLLGCSNSNVQDKVTETAQKVDRSERELTKKIDDIAAHVGELGGRIQTVEKEMSSVKQAIETLSKGELKVVDAGGLEGDKYTELSKNYDLLKQELASLQVELADTKKQVAAGPRAATPEYANDWKDMSVPAKLSEKLDKFSKEYAPKLDATGQRAEFETDIEQYKAEAAKEYTREELLAKYKASIQKQMEEAKDERMKEWYNRQILALDESSGDALDARLDNYRRYENMRTLSEIAKKYKISRNDFRNYGLQIYGGGWTPSEGGGNQ